jgi:hypothetical protein
VYTPYAQPPVYDQAPPAGQPQPNDQAQPAGQPQPSDQAQTAGQTQPAPEPSPASVDAAPAGAAEPAKLARPASRSHLLQTGFSLMPATGYRLIVRYNDHQYCADSSGIGDKPVCARRLPTVFDLQFSFGAMDRLDIILDYRFGLEEEPAVLGGYQFAIAPGLRFWLDRERAAKFYTTLQFVYDYADYSGSPEVPSHDFGLKNANGFMYDLIRQVGVFVQFGETIGLRRWFRIDLEIGLGVQVRLP